MAKQNGENNQAPEEASPELTLTEFCIRLSETDKRVELIGAFESEERAASRVKGKASDYADRYQKFINKPA